MVNFPGTASRHWRRAVRRAPAGLALFGCICLAPAGAGAASQPMPPAAWKAVVEQWTEDLRENEALLREGKYKKVKSRLDTQLREMAARFRTGSVAGSLIGSGSALRAIARAGLGDFEGAAWDWHVALTLAPEIARVDRAQFGAAGEYFSSEEFERRSDPGADEEEGKGDGLDATEDRSEEVVAPRKKFAPAPEYPRGKADACLETPVVIEVLIDREGRPRAPRLAEPGDPVLFFTATEAVRRWKFEPARLDGEPVTVKYHLTINYQIMFCPGGPRATGR